MKVEDGGKKLDEGSILSMGAGIYPNKKLNLPTEFSS